MSDRELLELAAKAAGMNVLREGEQWPKDTVGWFFNQVGDNPPALYDRATRSLTRWAPLTDDGDALRLAVKLRINIDEAVYIHTATNDEFEADPYATTRRSIVRAAAEIGKA